MTDLSRLDVQMLVIKTVQTIKDVLGKDLPGSFRNDSIANLEHFSESFDIRNFLNESESYNPAELRHISNLCISWLNLINVSTDYLDEAQKDPFTPITNFVSSSVRRVHHVPVGLIDQNDAVLSDIENMARWGCNFRSCQNVAEFETGVALTSDQIKKSVKDLLDAGAIQDSMSVSNPDLVINDAFDRLGMPDVTATVGYGGNGNDPDYTIMWGDTPNNSNTAGADHARMGDNDSLLLNDPYSPDIENMTHLYSNAVYLHFPEGSND